MTDTDKWDVIVEGMSELKGEFKEMRKENAKDHKELTGEISDMKERTARLEVKSGVWGTVGGMLAFLLIVGAAVAKGLL